MGVSSFLVLIVIAFTANNVFGCKNEIICFDNEVNNKINSQINLELTERYTYVYLSQIMDHHTNSHPKVAKYFKVKAEGELHAERLMQYQNKRGGTVEMAPVVLFREGSCANVNTVPQAFKCAMELEAYVTSKLTQLHHDVANIQVDLNAGCADVSRIADDDLRLTQPMLVTCTVGEDDAFVTGIWRACTCSSISSVSYIELEQMIAHDFLDHQLEDMKDLAAHYNTLKKIAAGSAPGLGYYLFDKHLEL